MCKYVNRSSVIPIRNLQVTGIPPFLPSLTAARMMARNKFFLSGTAAPPPLRVTLAAGQPKLRSMWSTALLATSCETARPIISGSEPYSCTLRRSSSGLKVMRRCDLGLKRTKPVAITISFTYTSPGPNCRHSERNGALVTPAIGAKTTGV